MKPSLILKRICLSKKNNPKANCFIAIVKNTYFDINKLIFIHSIQFIYEPVIKSIKL